MLKNEKGTKPDSITISKASMNRMIQHIEGGMTKKLAAARKNIESDKEISAGLYTYVLEELGKLLLLKKSELNDGKYVVRYTEEFVCHSKKFTTAFDYLSETGHGQCITINEGDFNAKDYNRHDSKVGLLANTKARLSIFYSDFEYSDETNKRDETIIVEKIPNVDKTSLENAINELQNVISSFQSSMFP